MSTGFASLAFAHTAGTISHGRVTAGEDGALIIRLDISPADFRHWPEAVQPANLAQKLASATDIQSPEGTCERSEPQLLQPETASELEKATLRISWSARCPGHQGEMTLHWLAEMPGHLQLLRIHDSTQLLRGGQPRSVAWNRSSSVQAGWQRVLGEQFRHGVMHIAAGWDHLAFLLGLLLLAPRLAALAVLVTGFTLGHTASLLFATLGQILPPSATIELAIAASIVFVGLPRTGHPRGIPAATGAPHRASLRGFAAWVTPLVMTGICLVAALQQAGDGLLWAGLLILALSHRHLSRNSDLRRTAWASLALAVVFGLLHGFGFASAVLNDAEQAHELWPVLLGFNLGVETGQLLFVLPAWWLLRPFSYRQPETTTALIRAVVLGIGGFALSGRLLGA